MPAKLANALERNVLLHASGPGEKQKVGHPPFRIDSDHHVHMGASELAYARSHGGGAVSMQSLFNIGCRPWPHQPHLCSVVAPAPWRDLRLPNSLLHGGSDQFGGVGLDEGCIRVRAARSESGMLPPGPPRAKLPR